MIAGKIIIKKYLKIRKDAKNVRNGHILYTLIILHFFDALKKNLDFIWLGYCLNESIILKVCSNDVRKYHISKILKN